MSHGLVASAGFGGAGCGGTLDPVASGYSPLLGDPTSRRARDGTTPDGSLRTRRPPTARSESCPPVLGVLDANVTSQWLDRHVEPQHRACQGRGARRVRWRWASWAVTAARAAARTAGDAAAAGRRGVGVVGSRVRRCRRSVWALR